MDKSTDPPSKDKVKMAIAKRENGKAAGIDKISAELHKTEDVWTLISHNLHKHFTQDRVI